MTLCTSLRQLGLAGLFLAVVPSFGAAQPAPQGAASGPVMMNRDQPVKIESTTLEVRDKSRMATFTGDVKLTQGDTILQCKVLVVFYEDSAAPGGTKAAPKTAGPGPGGGQQKIKRVEAKGNVIVTQKDQTASGDNGVFDPKSNTVVITGNVVVTQGTSVVRGERMTADLNTGKYTVESCKTGCRVESLFLPNAPKDAKPAPPAAPQSAKPAPMRIN